MKYIKSCVIIFILANLFEPAFAINQSSLNPGSLIINEINWAGSFIDGISKSSDEWIEIYNSTDTVIDLSTITLSGAASSEIILKGTIKPKSYFIITNYDPIKEESETIIEKKLIWDSYLVNSKISISNSGFHIKLKSGTQIVDEVNNLDGVPFAGLNDNTNLKRGSMAKISPELPSNDPASWKTSFNKRNVKSGISFCNNFGTPLNNNFPNPTELGVTQIEFEESCFDTGEIVTEASNIFLKKEGTQNNLEIFKYQFTPEDEKRRVEIRLNTKFNSQNPENFINLELQTGGEILISKNFYKKSDSMQNFSIDFIPDFKKAFDIKITTKLDPGNFIYLDKVIIRESPITNNEFILDAKTIDSYDGELQIDNLGEENLFFQKRENLTKPLFTEFSSQQIFEDSKVCRTSFVLKFPEIIDQSLKDTAAIIKIENPFSSFIKTKKIYFNDIKSNDFQEYFMDYKCNNLGTYKYELFSNQNMFIKNLSTKIIIPTDKFDINFLDIVMTRNYDFDLNDSFYITSKIEKIMEFNPEEVFFNTDKVNLNFDIKNIDIDPNEYFLDIFLYNIEPDGLIFSEIYHVKGSEIKVEDFSKISIPIHFGLNSKVGFKIFSNSNSDFLIKNINFTPAIDTISQIKIKSLNKIDWTHPQLLKSDIKEYGFSGKMVDILKVENVKSDNLALNLKIKKLEQFSTKNPILKINAFNDKGKKLYEKSFDENDLSSFNENILEENLEVTGSKEIYFFIKFYGNFYGAYSDLELNSFSISEV